MADALGALIESSPPERLATGFVFTEGPLWPTTRTACRMA